VLKSLPRPGLNSWSKVYWDNDQFSLFYFDDTALAIISRSDKGDVRNLPKVFSAIASISDSDHHETFPATHQRFASNQQALRTLYMNVPYLLFFMDLAALILFGIQTF
jgi:hypothetical protein